MVTITDIARSLGVTPSTVSRALAGSPRVKEKTRIAVEKKAAELGYEPNFMASNLRKGKSKIVGIIVPRVHREFFANVIGGAESVLWEAGYSAIICQTMESLEEEKKALKTLKNYRVAAIMMSHAIEAVNGEHIKGILYGSVPLIQFDRIFPDLPGAKIVGNDCKGAYDATKHLIEQGYRKIGTVAGYMSTLVYVERLAGYRMALEDSGIPYDESLVFYGAIVRETGYQAGKDALAAGCDALYCAGAFSALGAMDAAKEAGLRIPEDIGIVGTANEGFTSFMTPSMTTLAQHPYEMGQAAARTFLEGRTNTEVIDMDLMIRQSSNHNNQCLK